MVRGRGDLRADQVFDPGQPGPQPVQPLRIQNIVHHKVAVLFIERDLFRAKHGAIPYGGRDRCPGAGSYNKISMIGGQISRMDSASSWMPIKGRKPLKISVNEICGGATDFR